MGLEDLLKMLEQVSGAQPTSTSSNADPLSDLLGSLLGGNQPLPTSPGQSPRSRRSPSSSVNVDSNGALAGMLTPIAQELANKLGLPPDMAQMVITFAVSQLMNSQANARASSTGAQDLGSVLAQSRGMLANADGGLESSGLVAHLSSGKSVDSSFLHSSGMAQQLAAQTGMDTQTAANSLQQVFSLLGGASPTPSPASSPFGRAGGSVGASEKDTPSQATKSAPPPSKPKSHKK